MNQCLVFIVLQYFEKVINKKNYSNFKAHMQKCIDIMYSNNLGKMIVVIIVC